MTQVNYLNTLIWFMNWDWHHTDNKKCCFYHHRIVKERYRCVLKLLSNAEDCGNTDDAKKAYLMMGFIVMVQPGFDFKLTDFFWTWHIILFGNKYDYIYALCSLKWKLSTSEWLMNWFIWRIQLTIYISIADGYLDVFDEMQWIS